MTEFEIELERAKAERERVLVAQLGRPRWIPHTPTPRQKLWLDLDCREALYGGAGGGGKTDAILMSHLRYADTPGYSGLIMMRTYADLSKPKAAMDRMAEWLTGTGARWSGEKKQWRFPSGAVISFGYLASDQDKYNYKTAEYQQITIDEVTRFPLTDYEFLFSRLRRLAGSNVPIRMRPTCNPPEASEPGYSWVKARFIPQGWRPAWAETTRVWWKEGEDGRGRKVQRAFVPSRLEDNPHLDQEAYDDSLSEMDKARYAQIRKGDWDAQRRGNIYNDFTDGYNGHHVITWEQFEAVFGVPFIPHHWKGNMGQDKGYSPDPCATLWNFTAAENAPVAHSVPLAGSIFVPGILTCREKGVSQVGDAIIEKEQMRGWSGQVFARYLSHEANEWEATYKREKKLNFQRWKPGADLGIGRVQYQQEIKHLNKPHPFKPWLMGRPNYYLVVPNQMLDGYTPSLEDPDADEGLGLLRAEFLAYRWVVPNVTEQRGSTKIQPYDYFNHYMDAQRGIAQMCFPLVAPRTQYEQVQEALPPGWRDSDLSVLPWQERDLRALARQETLDDLKQTIANRHRPQVYDECVTDSGEIDAYL